MTIYKQPGSPYYYYDFWFEGRRYQKSTHLRNKTIAHRVECVRKAELAQRRGGILPRKQIPLLRGFAEWFLHTIKVERRSNTHRSYLSCVRNLEPAFGSKYLDEITPEMIWRFKEARLEKHLSPATVNRDLSCLRQILGMALKEELIVKSPTYCRVCPCEGREIRQSGPRCSDHLAGASHFQMAALKGQGQVSLST